MRHQPVLSFLEARNLACSAYTVLDHNGNPVFPPLNGKHLKRYHAPEHMFRQKPLEEANLEVATQLADDVTPALL